MEGGEGVLNKASPIRENQFLLKGGKKDKTKQKTEEGKDLTIGA